MGIILGAMWTHRIWVGVSHVGHSRSTAVGIGMLVALTSLALHSLVDFHMQIPAHLLLTAACIGLISAAMTSSVRQRESDSVSWHQRTVATLALLALAIGLGRDAVRDQREDQARAFMESFQVRPMTLTGLKQGKTILGDLPTGARRAMLGVQLARTEDSDEAWTGAWSLANEAILRTPLDADAHLSSARAAMALTVRSAKSEGLSTQTESWLAQLETSLARLNRIQGNNPRLLVEIANLQLMVSASVPWTEAYRARATHALAQALSMDPWLAADVFEVARDLDTPRLRTLPRPDARSMVEYGKALRHRKLDEEAEDVFTRALALDSLRGEAAFHLAGIAQLRDDTESEHRWL
ncbi:MAG: hypothetical protein QGG40_22295, partial [Myxococcota bacterium]|nr:hypothetical protein [Myxococcota bacterium]